MTETAKPARTIVIAIDHSDEAEKAFDYYTEHLHLEGNRLVLVHSTSPPHINNQQALMIDAHAWDEIVGQEKSKVKVLEEKYSQKMVKANVSGSIKAIFSTKPGELIVQTSNDERATMIVIGSRGLGKVRRTILGSVSDYVLHHAACPVFVCKRS